MIVEVRPASEEDQRTFCNLWEFYIYDCSELDPRFEVDEHGEYLDAPVRYWTDPLHHPFLIFVDGAPSGFVLVNQTGDRIRIGQFFVMRKRRRAGVGKKAAIQSFERFPGPWIVGVTSANLAAQAFWRSVIGEYTQGDYTEKRDRDGIDFLIDNPGIR